MADVVVFHHARGLTPGVRAFADILRGLGHAVYVPDLFGGRTFDDVEEGVSFVTGVGFETVAERGAAAAPKSDELVVIGFSLGALPAQRLAQTRRGVRAAILCHSAIPLGTFADEWPDGVALQIHLCEEDPWAAEDRDAAFELVGAAADGELIMHRGSGHLVCDPTDRAHDSAIAAVTLDRIVRLVDRVDGSDRLDDHGRPDAPPSADELTAMLGLLEYQRATLAWKCAGLGSAELAATVGESSLTLGGLLKHLALVEASWFRGALHGEDRRPPFDSVDWAATPDWDFESASQDSPDELRSLWDRAVADARWGIVMALADGGLDRPAARRGDRTPNLRWIVLHMIEEYARHNGHADLLREAVDGVVGE